MDNEDFMIFFATSFSMTLLLIGTYWYPNPVTFLFSALGLTAYMALWGPVEV